MRASLRDAVTLRESVKRVVETCGDMKLLSVGTMASALRVGHAARGFAVVAADLRVTGDTLASSVRPLDELADALVTLLAGVAVRQRRSAALRRASELGQRPPSLVAALDAAHAHAAEAEEALRALRLALAGRLDVVHDASADALAAARTAKLETTGAGLEGQRLAEAARRFEEAIEGLRPSLRELSRLAGDLV
jgi:hypothetical protein